jgi:hypothetical protein
LLARHSTREQARFFLEQRGRSLAEVEARHARQQAALQTVSSGLPMKWRRSRLDRADLDRFVFGPEDVVVVVGQDGLVANAAKYLTGQQVLGINPDRDLFDGVLVRHEAAAAPDLLAATVTGRVKIEARTMVRAKLDDGQHLVALNEIFIGHRTHQSARYRIRWHDTEEAQSSSGLIISTGTGATGWARSIARQKARAFELPEPTESRLAFFVREPFPSRSTGTSVEEGTLTEGEAFVVASEMNELGTVFGDGIEADRLEFGWGMQLTVGIAPNRLNLIIG